MQILEQPRLVTESQDVHLLRTFLIGTKENRAGWKVSKEDGHKIAQKFINKDFYIIPEKIFKPLDEGRGGHAGTQDVTSFSQELTEIKNNSHGIIKKLYGPLSYDDGTDDYYYDAGINLSGSKAASVLIENGSKTWVPFSVSAHLWSTNTNQNMEVTDAEAMGLGLVIKGAYGDDAVVRKYCSGGAVNCNKSLAASIADVINSHIQKTDNSSLYMSAQTQQVEQVSATPEIKEVVTPLIKEVEKQVEEVKQVELPKEEGIRLSKDEYESYRKERDEHKQLVLENKTNKLNQVFHEVSDEETKKTLVNKYIDKDVNLVIELNNDFNKHILPLHIEATKKEGEKILDEANKGSKTSSLRAEPKVEKGESKTSSVTSEVTANDLFMEMFS